MPSAALKHLSKKAGVSIKRAEHLWTKAKLIVDKEYGHDHEGYYALVMGITKKMMGLSEKLSFSDYLMLVRESSDTSLISDIIKRRLQKGEKIRVELKSWKWGGSLVDLSGELVLPKGKISFNGMLSVNGSEPNFYHQSWILYGKLIDETADDLFYLENTEQGLCLKQR